jgi:hypothetical protein
MAGLPGDGLPALALPSDLPLEAPPWALAPGLADDDAGAGDPDEQAVTGAVTASAASTATVTVTRGENDMVSILARGRTAADNGPPRSWSLATTVPGAIRD